MIFTIKATDNADFPYAIFNIDNELCDHAESFADAEEWIADHSEFELIGQNGFAYPAQHICNLHTGEGYYVVGKHIVMSEDHKTVYRTICTATKKNIAEFAK